MDATAQSPATTSETSTDADQEALLSTLAAPIEDGAGIELEDGDGNNPWGQAALEAWDKEQERLAALAAANPEPEAVVSVPETTETEKVEPEAAGPAAEADDAQLAKNFRLHANTDEEAMVYTLLKRNPGMTLMEAFSKVIPQKAPSDPAAQEAEPAAPVVSELDAITAQQEELKAEFTAAYENMEFEKAGGIQLKLIDLLEAKTLANQKLAQAAEAQKQEQSQEWQKFENQASDLYPQAEDQNGAFRQKMLEIYYALDKAGDPLLDKPESTLRIAQMAAATLGIAPATVKAAAPAPQAQSPVAAAPPQPAPVKVRPMDGGSNHGAVNHANTAQLEAQMASWTPEQWHEFNAKYPSGMPA